jgi:hypothetical protein
MRRTFTLALLAAAAASTAMPAQAQLRSRLRGGIDGGLLIAQPVGTFKNYVNAGVGFGLGGGINLDRDGIVSLRGDLGFLIYGSETMRSRLGTGPLGRVDVDVTTSNNIVMGTVGPQLAVPSGPIRPYVNGFVGFSYFFTQSGVEGASTEYQFANSENYHDGGLTLGYTVGTKIPLVIRNRVDVSIDLSARYFANGTRRYLREGSITDGPNGPIFTPIESETNLWAYRIGASIGLPHR